MRLSGTGVGPQWGFGLLVAPCQGVHLTQAVVHAGQFEPVNGDGWEIDHQFLPQLDRLLVSRLRLDELAGLHLLICLPLQRLGLLKLLLPGLLLAVLLRPRAVEPPSGRVAGTVPQAPWTPGGISPQLLFAVLRDVAAPGRPLRFSLRQLFVVLRS